MADVDDLRAHLADTYGFRAQAVFSFEDDVVLVRDASDRRWIARVFPAERPVGAVEGDVAILRWLARRDYPAERPACGEPVSVLSGQPVMVTEAVRAVPRAERRQTIKDAGGIRGLGALLARLHGLALDGDADSASGTGGAIGTGAASAAVHRPGGAWHHMTDGRPADELAVAADWLEQAQARAGVRELPHFGTLADALESIDDCGGLPEALIHPDFVLPNVVAAEDGQMVLVDWAGAGHGPRLWSLAFLLWAEGAKDLRRVDLAVAGYRSLIQLEAEELERLGAVIGARSLIFDIWRLHHQSRAVADAAAAWTRGQAECAAITERARAAFRR
jgi:Ser/Thr protein kinase RdoA (MazF antagonist)